MPSAKRRWIIASVVAASAATAGIAWLLLARDSAPKNPPRRSEAIESWDGFGAEVSVMTGIGLEIPGVSPKKLVWRVPEGDPGKISVWIDTRIVPSPGAPCRIVGAPCTRAETAKLRFFVSALLDYEGPVSVEGSRHAEFVRVGAARQRNVFALGVQPLSAGRHCIVVALMENPREVLTFGFPINGGVWAFVVEVGASKIDHCRIPPGPPKSASRLGPGSGPACRRGIPLKPVGSEKNPTFEARIGVCTNFAVVVFLRDGVLQGVKDLPPLTLPGSDAEDRAWRVRLRLPEGAWQYATIEPTGDGWYSRPPVLAS